MKEEQYAIASFPNKKYIDHVVPESSEAADVANEIMSLLKDTESTDTLQEMWWNQQHRPVRT